MDILRYLSANNKLKPTRLKDVDVGVVVADDFIHSKLSLYEHCCGNQAHMIKSIFDDVINQLFSKILIGIELEWIAVKGF